MNETISVVLPVLAMDKRLKPCLKRFLAQTYPSLELILPAAPGLGEDLAAADPRVRLLPGEYGSLTEAAVAGAQAAAGDCVAFADPASRPDADMLEKMRRALAEKQADVVISPNRVPPPLSFQAGKDQEAPHEPWRDVLFGGRKALYELIVGRTIEGVLWDKLFRRSLFDGLSAAAEDEHLRDDTLLVELFRRTGRVVRLYKPLYERPWETASKDFRGAVNEVLLRQKLVELVDRACPLFLSGAWTAYGEAMEALVVKAVETDQAEGLKYQELLTGTLAPFYGERGRAALNVPWKVDTKYQVLLSRPVLFWHLWPMIRRVKTAILG